MGGHSMRRVAKATPRRHRKAPLRQERQDTLTHLQADDQRGNPRSQRFWTLLSFSDRVGRQHLGYCSKRCFSIIMVIFSPDERLSHFSGGTVLLATSKALLNASSSSLSASGGGVLGDLGA